MAMVEIQPIRVELEREENGRMLASLPDLPGVMAYGSAEEEAMRKVKSIALQVLADLIKRGEEGPEPLKVLFAARALGAPPRPRQSMQRCCTSVGPSRSRLGRIERCGVRAGPISGSFMRAKKSDRLRSPRG
jgi:predicted RNase H-like HicB family nuclease